LHLEKKKNIEKKNLGSWNITSLFWGAGLQVWVFSYKNPPNQPSPSWQKRSADGNAASHCEALRVDFFARLTSYDPVEKFGEEWPVDAMNRSASCRSVQCDEQPWQEPYPA